MAQKDTSTPSPVSEAAAAMGRLGGSARAKKLSAKRRKEIAKAGATARWKDGGGKEKKTT